MYKYDPYSPYLVLLKLPITVPVLNGITDQQCCENPAGDKLSTKRMIPCCVEGKQFIREESDRRPINSICLAIPYVSKVSQNKPRSSEIEPGINGAVIDESIQSNNRARHRCCKFQH